METTDDLVYLITTTDYYSEIEPVFIPIDIATLYGFKVAYRKAALTDIRAMTVTFNYSFPYRRAYERS